MRGAVVVALAVGASAADPCASYTDCAQCTGDVSCGWCSRPVLYEDNSTGPQCAGPKTSDPFTCPSIYSTVKCLAGYACASGKCVEQPPGQGDPLDECKASCSGPAADVYLCNKTTKTCSKVPPGTPGSAGKTECQHICAGAPPPPPVSVYACHKSNSTCLPAAPGTPGSTSKDLCESSCMPTFVCNYESGTYQCKEGTGSSGNNRTTCEAECRKPGDPCTDHYTCADCLAAGPQCGWCSENVTYVSGQPGTQCAGVDPTILPFQCPGSYSTDACSPHKPDPCANHSTCNTCVADQDCGWCSFPVKYSDGTTGAQCAGPAAGKFTCSGIYSTEYCEAGYRCDKLSNGTQCTKLKPGQGVTLHSCNANCIGPVAPVYLCNATTKACARVPAYTPGSTSKELCESNCTVPQDPVYECNTATRKCEQVPTGTHGATSKFVCDDHCGLYSCDYSKAPNYACKIGYGNWTDPQCTDRCKPPNDPCKAHGGSCSECLAAGPHCGWCTTPVRYISGEPGTQCAGVDSSILPFSCDGSYTNDRCP